MILFEVLATSELFEHDHFVASILRRFVKEGLLLLILSRIYYIGPILLILGLKVAQEFIEGLITLRHRPNARIQRLSWRILLRFYEFLKFLDLCDCLRTASGLFTSLVLPIGEE